MSKTVRHEDLEEEEVDNDLLVVAKFAQLDVRPTETISVNDPAEIDLSEDTPLKVESHESSSSSSSEDDEIDEQIHEGVEVEEEASDIESDVDANVKEIAGPRTPNELPYGSVKLDPLPSQQSLFPVDRTIDALKITTVQEKMLVASSLRSPVLDTGSVVCTQDRILVGRVDDVFGPVVSPFYTVRVMCEERPELKVGDVLCWVEKYSVIVNCAALNTRGTDASNIVDEETSEEESSDDEHNQDNEVVDHPRDKISRAINSQKLSPRQTSQARHAQGKGSGSKGRSAVTKRPGQRGKNTNSSTNFSFPSTAPSPQKSQQEQTSHVMAPVAPTSQPSLPPGWPQPKYPPGWPAPRF